MINSQTIDRKNAKDEAFNKKVDDLKRFIINDLLSQDPTTAAHNIHSLYETYGVVYFESIRSTLNQMIKEAITALSDSNKTIFAAHKSEKKLFSQMLRVGMVERIVTHEKLQQMFCNEISIHQSPHLHKRK